MAAESTTKPFIVLSVSDHGKIPWVWVRDGEDGTDPEGEPK